MSNVLERAKIKWAGVERETLKLDATALGVELKGNWSDQTARDRLVAAVGEIAPLSDQKTDVPKQERPTTKPNLTTVGRWGGRCRDVTIYRPAGETSSGCPLSWDGFLIYVPFDRGDAAKYTIPEPHFNVLKDAKLRALEIDARMDKKQGIVRIATETESQAFPFAGGEVTPGTEHLPGSLLEWYQWEAERKDYFELFKKSRLEEIWGELTNGRAGETVPGGGFKEWDRERLRTEILRFLGPKYLAKISQDEFDPALSKAAA